MDGQNLVIRTKEQTNEQKKERKDKKKQKRREAGGTNLPRDKYEQQKAQYAKETMDSRLARASTLR